MAAKLIEFLFKSLVEVRSHLFDWVPPLFLLTFIRAVRSVVKIIGLTALGADSIAKVFDFSQSIFWA